MGAINLSSKLGENLLINPSMDLWQRGIAFVGIANDDYFADRFIYGKSGTMVHDINRSTDVPVSNLLNYSSFMNVTTAQASITAGDFTTIQQRIEGFNARKVHGKNIFIKFKVKATKPGIYCAALVNGAADRNYIVEYTVDSANTWEEKTVRIKHDLTGTWLKDNGIGLRIIWTIAAGSTFQGSADAWQAGNLFATANQVNGVDAVNNEFRIAQVQLHEGIDEIPFEDLVRDIQQELELSQRYFENISDFRYSGGIQAAQQKYYPIYFKVDKRIVPVMTGTCVAVYNCTSGSMTFTNISVDRVDTYRGGTTGSLYHVAADVSDCTADAEL